VVGIARVATAPHPDPRDARGSWSVEVRPVRRLVAPVPLAELKADRALAGFLLLRISRLSVVPVTSAEWKRILAHEPRHLESRLTAAAEGPARASGTRRPGSAAPRRRSPANRTGGG